MIDGDLENRFTYHPPTGDKPQYFQDIRHEAYLLGCLIDQYAPDGREKSLAITKLEEAVMWANAAIARST